MNVKEIILDINGCSQSDLEPKLDHLLYNDAFAKLASNKTVIVITDADADGMCAARIWREYRKGSKDEIRFLNRQNRSPLDVMGKFDKSKVYVFLDCASSEELPSSSNIFVIDHHESRVRIENVNYINPKMDGNDTSLCTSTLLYLLFEAYTGKIISTALQYAAIAGVADMTPMLGDNRNVVSRGLIEMNTHPCDIAKEFPTYGKSYTESHIGYMIAPAINAPSRLGEQQVAIDAVVYGKNIAMLKTLNNRRKTVAKNILKNSKIIEGKNTVAAIIDTENMAVTGLVANQIVSKYGKPAICINMSDGAFSIRSKSIDAEQFINNDESMTGGGHKQAAGGTLDLENLNNIIQRFDRYASGAIAIDTDAGYDIFLDHFFVHMAKDESLSLSPFGQKFRKPIFAGYMQVYQIGQDFSTKSIENGFTKLRLKFGQYVFHAVCYDVPMKIDLNETYFFIFEIDEKEFLIRGIETN